jgi:transcriptional regulator with XRE-family HTH domain
MGKGQHKKPERGRKGMKINEIIRAKRREQGMTQEQAAAALGVSASAVHKWEKGVSHS